MIIECSLRNWLPILPLKETGLFMHFRQLCVSALVKSGIGLRAPANLIAIRRVRALAKFEPPTRYSMAYEPRSAHKTRSARTLAQSPSNMLTR